MPVNTTDAVSLFPSFFVCCVREVDADSFREGGGVSCACVCVRVCTHVSCVLAGVSDNEMQKGTKSWGPPFSVLQLHFHSRQSMIPPYPLSCVRVCVYVCRRRLLCVIVFTPPSLLLVFCMADPPNVITVSACLIYSRRE